MPVIKAESGQTWVDLVLQELGDEHRLFELCDLNNASITDAPMSGDNVTVPDYEISQRRIVNTLRKYKPASGTDQESNETPEGIGYWKIQDDFIVS